jgi:hypothetical protein
MLGNTSFRVWLSEYASVCRINICVHVHVNNAAYFHCLSRREKLQATLDDICNEIDAWELPLALSELLQDLLPKLYSNSPPAIMARVLQKFSDYYTNPNRTVLPWGALIEQMSPVEYWKFYAGSSDEAMKIAGDFAIRMVGCGVTECGVERVFSHINWLVGDKRRKLSEKSLGNLASLKYGS